jgi:Spy/CpxP family protein refolding chaperone
MKKVLVIAALVIGTASMTKAQGGGGGFAQMTPEQRMERTLASLEPLKLTADQVTKVKVILTAQNKSRDSIRTAMGQGGDRQAMMAKNQEIQKAADDKISAILTAEQKTAYAEIVKNRPARGGRGGGQGGQGGGQGGQQN